MTLHIFLTYLNAQRTFVLFLLTFTLAALVFCRALALALSSTTLLLCWLGSGFLNVNLFLADTFALAFAATLGLGLGDALVAALLLGLFLGTGLLVQRIQVNLANDSDLRSLLVGT